MYNVQFNIIYNFLRSAGAQASKARSPMYNVLFAMYRSALCDACVTKWSKNVQFLGKQFIESGLIIGFYEFGMENGDEILQQHVGHYG